MARRTPYIEISGPLFEDSAVRRFHDAVAEGMEELGEEGASILGAAISQRGFIQTGSFLRSIDTVAKRSDRDNSAGYVSIVVEDAWPKPDRPTKTWFERGTRGGVRLRTGGWGFRKTASALKAFDFETYFGSKIREALDD